MYTTEPVAFVVFLQAFWASVAGFFPPDVALTVEPSGDTFEATTGVVSTGWSATPGDPVPGTGDANYAAPVGAVITWRTNTVIGRRRARGRSFLVPLAGNMFEADGSLAGGTVAGIQSAAGTLISDAVGTFMIWHRPTSLTAANGVAAEVTSATVPDLAAVLRSRRD